MGSLPEHSSVEHHKRFLIGDKTIEEKLEARIFVLEEETAALNRKLKDVTDKNRRWKDREERWDKQKVELRAEVARLEGRNTKASQELEDRDLEVARLKSGNVDLENICRTHEERIRGADERFDNYIQAVTTFTSHFRVRPPDPTMNGLPALPLESEHFGDRSVNSEARQPASSPLRPVPKSARAGRSTPCNGFEQNAASSAELTKHPKIKSEHEDHDHNPIQQFDQSAKSPMQTTARIINPSPMHLQDHEPLSTSSHRQGSPGARLRTLERSARKRASSPNVHEHITEKRRREESSGHDASCGESSVLVGETIPPPGRLKHVA
jgi:hypothetical protein